jgi:hypothetical protein
VVDLDRLLRSDISYAAADAVEPPDFAPLERRGARRRRTRSALVAATAVVALVVAGNASPRKLGAGRDTITPVEQPTPRRMPCCISDLVPGTYLAPSDESAAFGYTVTFPAGWDVQGGNEYYLHQDTPGRNETELRRDTPGGIGILPYLVDEIYADACRGDQGAVMKVGSRPRDLVTALLAQKGPLKSSPAQTTLGGYPATRVDLRFPPSLLDKNCFWGPGTGIQLWRGDLDRYLVLLPDSTVSIYVVDVNGRRQVFTAQYHASVTERDLAELRAILESIRIEAPAR